MAVRHIYKCPCKWAAVAIRQNSNNKFYCSDCHKEWLEADIIKQQPKYGWHTAGSDLYYELR